MSREIYTFSDSRIVLYVLILIVCKCHGVRVVGSRHTRARARSIATAADADAADAARAMSMLCALARALFARAPRDASDDASDGDIGDHGGDAAEMRARRVGAGGDASRAFARAKARINARSASRAAWTSPSMSCDAMVRRVRAFRREARRRLVKRAIRDAIAEQYVEDAFEMPKMYTTVDEESWSVVLRDAAMGEGMNESSVEAEGFDGGARKKARVEGGDGKVCDVECLAKCKVKCGRGLKVTEYVSKGSVIMELTGPSQLITAQTCAREHELSALVKCWLSTQTSASIRAFVPRELLRIWRREETLWYHAPWVTDEDCEGEGYVPNPTSRFRTLHLPLDEIVLSCFMVLERRKGKQSKWFDYISKLPTLEDFRKDVPMMIPVKQFVQMLGFVNCEKAHSRRRHSDSNLRFIIAERRCMEQKIELTYRHIVSKVDFKPETSGKRFTFKSTYMTREEFCWGYAVVMTRGFRSPNTPSGDIWRDVVRRKEFVGAFLAPYLDFASYKVAPNVECTVSNGVSGQGQVVARALADCHKGDFMHMSCNLPQSNIDLFLRYGYCAKNAKAETSRENHDFFYVDLDDLVRWFRNIPTDVIDARREMSIRFSHANNALDALSRMVDCVRPCVYQASAHVRNALRTRQDKEASCTATISIQKARRNDTDVKNEPLELNDDELEKIRMLTFGEADDEMIEQTKQCSPAFVAIKYAMEIKTLRLVRDWLNKLKCASIEACEFPNASHERLIKAYEIVRASRQRTFDLYANAAHVIADKLAASGPNSRNSLPAHMKRLILRRGSEDDFNSAVRELTRRYLTAFDSRLYAE